MLSVALFRPEIPPNTGNVARLTAALEMPLHIVGPSLFEISDKSARRAGLDYWPYVQLHQHADFQALVDFLPPSARIICFSSKASRVYWDFQFQPDDCLLFGQETRGLPTEITSARPELCVTIPQSSDNVRCLNLSTAVGIGVYEALRQTR